MFDSLAKGEVSRMVVEKDAKCFDRNKVDNVTSWVVLLSSVPSIKIIFSKERIRVSFIGGTIVTMDTAVDNDREYLIKSERQGDQRA